MAPASSSPRSEILIRSRVFARTRYWNILSVLRQLSAGLLLFGADEIAHPGLITSQVLEHVVNDALVIADLTERNPNVFYELAVRHAIRKPVVQLIAKGEPIPFDLAVMRTITVDHHDLDSVHQAKREIVSQILAACAPDAIFETPITTALHLGDLRNSIDPEDRSRADLMAAMEILTYTLSEVSQQYERVADSVADSVTAAAERTALSLAENLQQMTASWGMGLAHNTISQEKLREQLSTLTQVIERYGGSLVEKP